MKTEKGRILNIQGRGWGEIREKLKTGRAARLLIVSGKIRVPIS